MTPAVRQRLEQEGVLAQERNPLYLPKNSIRTIIIGTFFGLGIYLYREPRLVTPEAVALLSMVFAYLLVRSFAASPTASQGGVRNR